MSLTGVVCSTATADIQVYSPVFLSEEGGGEAESVERECSWRLSMDCSSCR